MTRGSSRAGCPTRMMGRLDGSRSTMLSTEIFEGPQTRTFFGRGGSGDVDGGGVTSCRISSSSVWVFPVPGGPWISAAAPCQYRW